MSRDKLIKRNQKIFQALTRGDITLDDIITNGGYLSTEQADYFIEKIYEARPGLIQDIRRESMSSPKMEINKLGITGNFLNVGTDDGTSLASQYRSKVTTSKVTLTTEELMGVMYLPYKVLEDNIARGRLEDVIMDEILPPKINKDLEKLIFQGDTTSGDNLLKSFNGLYKLCTDHALTYGQATGTVNDELWSDIVEALPWYHRENDEELRIYISPRISDTYAKWWGKRATGGGDQALILNHLKELNYRGIPLRKTPYTPMAKALMTYPQNVILGVQREIQVETDRDIQNRIIIVVVTMRVALQVEETDAVVTASGLNPSATTTA